MTEMKYDLKIRKVSRGTPAVSNENILATRHELAKVAPVQSINDIVLHFFLQVTRVRPQPSKLLIFSRFLGLKVA